MSDDCEEQRQGKAEWTWLGGKDTDESNEVYRQGSSMR